MKNITQNIALDFCRNEYKTICVKQYDKNSRHLTITCTNNGVAYKLDSSIHTCNVKMSTPSGRALLKSTDVATINDDGTVSIVFDEDMTYESGMSKLEIIILDENEKQALSPMLLNVSVIGSAYPDETVISSPEFSALTEAMLNVNNSIEIAEQATELANETIGRVVALETEVEEAEALRVNAENTRQINETERQDSMNVILQSYENIENAESIRNNNESIRETNEELRQTDFESMLLNLNDAIEVCENAANEHALFSKSYAVGNTGTRENEDVDNAKYYKEQAERISQGLSGALIPMGTVTFSQLANQSKQAGYMYNVSDAFTSDITFNDGGGHDYPEGTNVYYTADGYWDCLAGTHVTGVKGDNETLYRVGNVNITLENLGVVATASEINDVCSNFHYELSGKVDSDGSVVGLYNDGDSCYMQTNNMGDVQIITPDDDINGNAATATTLQGLTATVDELNYMSGVTSNVQESLDTLNGSLNELDDSLFVPNPFTHGGRKAVAMASMLHDIDEEHIYQLKYTANDGNGNTRTDVYLDSTKIGEIGYALNKDRNNGGDRITGVGVNDNGVFMYVDGGIHNLAPSDKVIELDKSLNELDDSLFTAEPFTHGGKKSVSIASMLHDMDKMHVYQLKYAANDEYGNTRTDLHVDGVKIGEIGYALNRDKNNGGERITGIGVDEGGVFLYVDGNKHHIQLID